MKTFVQNSLKVKTPVFVLVSEVDQEKVFDYTSGKT